MSDLPTPSVYFYGVVRGEHSGPIAGLTSIDGEGPVYGITYHDLTVIVSDAVKERYQVSRQHVLGHEAVVTALMAGYTVLPARFGSIRDRNAIVDELLVAYYELLHAQLTRVEGMVEVGLIVRWSNIQPMVAEIVAADPWLRAARRRLAIARTSQNMRLDVGKRLEQSLAAKRQAEAAEIVTVIKSYAAPDGVNFNSNGEEEGKVLDASFLVSRGQLDAFIEAVKVYDNRFDGRYLMTLGTPTAPYGFVPLLEAAIPRGERVLRRERVRRGERVRR